jgi:hypothetical protein
MEKALIDGVIWAIPETGRGDIDESQTLSTDKDGQPTDLLLGDLLSTKHPDWLFPFFVPQRAILDHDSTKVYFTHGGGLSANEALFHGKPVLSMGIFFDQTANTTRLVAGGVAESLDKVSFTADEIYCKIKKIVVAEDDGSYHRNVLRMQRIAHIAALRKNHAADLVEEVMYDNELRLDADGRELRPMHLQTADSRMSAFKANNWDICLVTALGLVTIVGSIGLAGHSAWRYRSFLVGQAQSIVLEGRVLLQHGTIWPRA